MGDPKDPKGFRRYAGCGRPSHLATLSNEDIRRLWAEFAQVVGPEGTKHHQMWYKYHLTHSSCVPYHSRAEGGRGSFDPNQGDRAPAPRKAIQGGLGENSEY